MTNNSTLSQDQDCEIREDLQKQCLEDFVQLKEIDLEINKGEFICVIGDVGSGKSSLLNALSGNMIYLSDREIKEFGGFQMTANQHEFKNLTDKILDKNYEVGDAPIKLSGSLSYVE